MASNYVILGLKTGATPQEIKSKFRSLSKQLHPDVNGGDKNKTDRFVIILAAYEALLRGDSGEVKQTQQKAQNQYGGYTATKQKKKEATYRFDGIKKDKDGYLVSFHIEGVSKIIIHGKDGNKIGNYITKGFKGKINLIVLFAAAKEGKYMFKITLFDEDGNSVTNTYKVKNPSMWGRIKETINNIF